MFKYLNTKIVGNLPTFQSADKHFCIFKHQVAILDKPI